MGRLVTAHEFVDKCNKECLSRKYRCARYKTVREYLTHLETRFERRKDVQACEEPVVRRTE
ncbi:MAG TPA: hypothetical protein GXX29_04380 [Firmicutes bacterium]|nr:hypothetical protein [Bacillota bacterium]